MYLLPSIQIFCPELQGLEEQKQKDGLQSENFIWTDMDGVKTGLILESSPPASFKLPATAVRPNDRLFTQFESQRKLGVIVSETAYAPSS